VTTASTRNRPRPATAQARLLLATAALLAGGIAAAHPEGAPARDGPAHAGRVLGQIEFPTTTKSAPAQAAFIQGMLLLHLFEYPYAEAQFQQAEQLDPGFAMAYWGEAMVHNHPIWDQQDAAQARAVLNRLAPTAAARAATTSSMKERDYLAGLEILYGEGSKADRDLAYLRHMQQMAARYPDDHEVRLFQALAIMGVHAGVRDVPDYMESAALSQSVFYANRQHPGAAHYLIHAVDDPVHAPLGLEAARALLQIAPDAGHSLHMTSHIFTALGMWDDVVAANTSAMRVANAMAMERGKPATHVGHYNFWLLYGLLQQGRADEAKTLLKSAYEETRDVEPPADPLILDPDDSSVGSMVQMWARYLLETNGTDDEVAGWRFNMGDAFDPNLTWHYALGMIARDSRSVMDHLAAFRGLQATLRERVAALPRQAPTALLYLDRLAVIEHQLQAVLARSQGDWAAAIAHAVDADRLEATMPYSFGPPFVDYPSAQLLGEMYLQRQQFELARDAFREQLKRSRRKTRVVEELEHAESAIAQPS